MAQKLSRSGDGPRVVLDTPGHFQQNILLQQHKTNHETSTGPEPFCLQNTPGYENPNMVSKKKVLQQKSARWPELFGAGVIVAWVLLFRLILLLDQSIRIFGGAVVI